MESKIKNKKENTRRLAESAVMLALSTVLSEIAVFKLPYGGSVTLFSQLPMIVISYRYGVKWGSFVGLLSAVIQMLFGLENFTYVSGLVPYLILVFADYIVAFGILGLGGMFKNKIKNQAVALTTGGIVVSLVRYLCHFVSGITIWQSYAEGMSVWKYSLTYNGSFMIPELIITAVGTIIVGSVFDLTSPEIKTLKRTQHTESK